MPKYKVTNTSHSSSKGNRNVFLTEAGKLLKPGEHCVCNRLDNGTRAMAKAGILKVEEGSFARPPIFPPKEDEKVDNSAAEAAEKARLEAEAKAQAEAKAKAKAAAEAEAKAKAEAEAEAASQESEGSEKKSKRSKKKNRGEG